MIRRESVPCVPKAVSGSEENDHVVYNNGHWMAIQSQVDQTWRVIWNKLFNSPLNDSKLELWSLLTTFLCTGGYFGQSREDLVSEIVKFTSKQKFTVNQNGFSVP